MVRWVGCLDDEAKSAEAGGREGRPYGTGERSCWAAAWRGGLAVSTVWCIGRGGRPRGPALRRGGGSAGRLASKEESMRKRIAFLAAVIFLLALAASLPPTAAASPEKSASAATLEVTYYYI